MTFYRTLLVTLFVLFCASSLESQIINNYGLKASLVRSNFNITDKTPITIGGYSFYPDYIDGASLHPSIGMFLRTEAIENLNLEIEMLYIQKGASKTYKVNVITGDSPDGTGEMKSITSKISLDYLHLAFNIQPTTQVGSNIIYASIGPSINYLVSPSSFAVEDVKKIVLGYNFGLGMDLGKIINAPVFFELKYGGELSPFYSYTSGKYWNNVFLLNLGVNL